MMHLGNDHWQVELTPEHLGMLHFRIQAWVDDWASYRDELEKKHQAGVPVELELQEGERLIHEGLAQAAPEHIDMLEELLVALAEPGTTRSEERRVGKECRYRGAADDEKEKKRVGSEGIET